MTKKVQLLKTRHVDQHSKRIQFGQLYGMGDYLSLYILQSGFRAFKYVPYGPIEYPITYKSSNNLIIS